MVRPVGQPHEGKRDQQREHYGVEAVVGNTGVDGSDKVEEESGVAPFAQPGRDWRQNADHAKHFGPAEKGDDVLRIAQVGSNKVNGCLRHQDVLHTCHAHEHGNEDGGGPVEDVEFIYAAVEIV